MDLTRRSPVIAVFDSGLGGLTILAAIVKKNSTALFVYYGDTANAPYGPRSADDIFKLSLAAITEILKSKPDVIVIACNTVTSTSLKKLRDIFPAVTFIGVEPVVKPAAALSRTKKIYVVATAATLASESYAALKKLWATDVEVIDAPRPAWVKMVEDNAIHDIVLTEDAADIRAKGADVLVLACTHFPFLKPKLQQLLPELTILDSAEPVAEQVGQKLPDISLMPISGKPNITWIFSNPARPSVVDREQLWTRAQDIQ